MVIDKADQKLMEENKSTMKLGNFEEYDENGQINFQSIYKRINDRDYHRITYRNQRKSSEEYVVENGSSSNFKLWAESGNLIFEQTNLSNFEIQISYYDDKLNSIKEIRNKKKQKPEKYKGIQFENQIDSSYWVEQKLLEERLFLEGEVIEFHPNGEKRSSGKYSKRLFTVYRNKDTYRKLHELNQDVKQVNDHKQIINKRGLVKDGVWKYFDLNGNLIKEEVHKEGKLIKEIPQ
jgi:antitoxin component YwqK of YwqJK toxin-antitoxin module